MTLEKHIVDTMKEWQLKMGSIDSGIVLYYPKDSLCRYLGIETDQGQMDNTELKDRILAYLGEKAPELEPLEVSFRQDRFCIRIGKNGCMYVEQQVDVPEFLANFLQAYQTQTMEKIRETFERYAEAQGTTVICDTEEDGMGTVLYLADEDTEPYVYCVEQDDFGITYHRFARSDYEAMK